MPCTTQCQTDRVLNLAAKGRALVLEESLVKGEGCMSCCNKNKDTLLIVAAKHGHIKVVQILLQQFGREFIEMFNKTGKRPLHEAAQNQRLEIAQFLIDQGASVDALKQGDWTPLMLAAEKQNLDIVQLLVRHGADVSLVNKDGWNAFHIAARAGNIEILDFLHALNPQLIKTVSKNGRTPLHSAALNDCCLATDWLLQQGLCPNVVDSSGLTPLMDGARMGHEGVCDVLLAHGADLLQLDCLQRTALHHVTQAGQTKMIQWCINHAEQALNSRRLHNSSHYSDSTSVQRKDSKRSLKKKSSFRKSSDLISKSADSGNANKSFVNWKSEQGSTALHYAAKESRKQEIKILLQFGADKTIPDNFGRLPIAMGNCQDVRFLLE